MRQAQNLILGLSGRPTHRSRRPDHSPPARNHPRQSPIALTATTFAPLTDIGRKLPFCKFRRREAPRALPGYRGEAPRALPGYRGEAPRALPGYREAPRALPGYREAPRALPGYRGEAPRALPGQCLEDRLEDIRRKLPLCKFRRFAPRSARPTRDQAAPRTSQNQTAAKAFARLCATCHPPPSYGKSESKPTQVRLAQLSRANVGLVAS